MLRKKKVNIIKQSKTASHEINNHKIDQARSAAVNLVYAVMENNAFINLSLEQAFEGRNLSSVDRSFATAAAYGTVTNVVVIDAILSEFSKISLAKIEPGILAILRTAVWQIFWSDSIPDFAACNESVHLAKNQSNAGAASFVNGLLRTLVREKESIKNRFIENPRSFHLRCVLPHELAGYFKKWFGSDRAVAICRAMTNSSKNTVRVNIQKISLDILQDKLENEGCTLSSASFMENAFVIRTNGSMMENLPSFQNGEFMIQDEAAMLVGIIANPSPNNLVMDLCAAPGGKTCHLAELMGDKGRIIACDIHLSRLLLVKQNAERLGFSIIEYMEMDATQINQDLLPDSIADLVLADVPCSGLGILGRKPDIRIHMTHEKMQQLYPVQKQIFENAARLVKPGGYLVYSTCTLNPAENELQVQEFMENHAGEFERVDFSGLLPEKLILMDSSLIESAIHGSLTLFPNRHGCDGFFIAKLKKVNRF